jgi:hypothetical protein
MEGFIFLRGKFIYKNYIYFIDIFNITNILDIKKPANKKLKAGLL